MTLRFEGKVALVVGSATGIGRATCEQLAREGAIIAAVDRKESELNELTNTLRAKDAKVRSFAGDACNREFATNAVNAVHKEFGRIDVLINTVGGNDAIPNPQRLAEELELEDWRTVVLFNLDSMFLFCKATIPIMKSQRAGKIVNVSSQAGRGQGRHSGAGYAAGKGGVIAFTKKLSTELGPFGINVNAIAPGLTLTARALTRWNARTEQFRANALEQIPLRRAGTAEEQGSVICFLASSDADYVTGLTIDVSGGV